LHLWLVNPFDPLPSDRGVRPMRYQMLVAELLRRGHTVTWICSDFLHIPKVYRQPATREHLPAGLEVVAIHTRSYRKNISLARVINHAQYSAGVRQWMARNTPPDGIVVSYPLPETALDCLHYGRAHGVPVVVDVQDQWPDAFLEFLPQKLHRAGRLLLSNMFQQARQVFNLAEHCVTVSQHYLRYAESLRDGKPFASSKVYYLGYDPVNVTNDSQALADLAGRGFTPETINFTFIGTLGTSYDIDCVIKAAQIIERDTPQARFFIAGDGPMNEQWQAQVARLGLRNVGFLGFLNATQLQALLSHSFAGLVTIRKNRQSIQNKPNEYMAFGLPLISSLQGEFAQLVDNEPLGVSYEAEDVASLVQAIRRLLDDRAFVDRCRQRVRQVFTERFSARAIYPAYVADLEQICAPSGQLLEVMP